MKSNIRRLTIDTGRLFSITDPHGCYEKVLAALESVDFNYDEDKLLINGDMVDRGPDSLSCFNMIYKSWVIANRGNHEDFCLQYMRSTSTEERESIKQTHISNGGLWFYSLPHEVQAKIADDIEALPVVTIVERKGKQHMFVHGDLPSYVHSLTDLEYFIDGASSDNVITQCIWGRSKARQIRTTRLESLYNIDGVEHVYFGHTVMKEKTTVGNMTWFDTGAVFTDAGYGNLTILEIE